MVDETAIVHPAVFDEVLAGLGGGEVTADDLGGSQ
jgi:hypothetical protein